MKRLIMISALLAVSIQILAQQKGEIPEYGNSISYGNALPLVQLLAMDHYSNHYNTGLEDIYKDRYGDISISFLHKVEYVRTYRPWFSLSYGASLCTTSQKVTDGYTGQHRYAFHGYSVTFLPQARFMPLNKRHVKIYGSIGLGYTFNHHFGKCENGESWGNSDYMAFQFIPFGIEFGSRMFGMAELGFGSEFVGYKLGVGYRF